MQRQRETVGAASRGSRPASARTRIRGLDGLRTLAVVLVLGYHLLAGQVESGFVGVDVFFVISGFLITALLLREREESGSINIVAFWRRRIRRLVPAVVVATIGTVWLARVIGGDAAVQLPWQAIGSVTGTYNWLEIVHHSSYFERQSPMLLTNMWSLAVEQQFYLLWPLALWVILAAVPARLRPRAALIIAAASAMLHASLVGFGGDVTRAYVGTDTHCFGLMIGAALALALPGIMSGKRRRLSVEETRPRAYAGIMALFGIVAIAVLVPDSAVMYPWGMLVASLLAAVLIRAMLPDMAASQITATFWEFFDSRPMKWIGERSYGIYLWHWPLWVIAYYTMPFSVWEIAVFVGLLAVVLAHLSYTFVETPVRRYGFLESLRRFGAFLTGDARRLMWAIPTAVLVFGIFIWGLVSSPDVTSAERYVEAGREATASASATPEGASDKESVAASEEPPGEEARPAEDAEEEVESADSAPSEVPMPEGGQVSIIGDSVALASSAGLAGALPEIAIDAQVSRSIEMLDELIVQHENAGDLREYVVIALASNAIIRSDNLDAMLEALGSDRKIVLVTGYGPERTTWIPPSNVAIREFAQAHPEQVRVADWEPIAAAHQELLAGDRVHPNAEGGALYAAEVVRALDSF